MVFGSRIFVGENVSKLRHIDLIVSQAFEPCMYIRLPNVCKVLMFFFIFCGVKIKLHKRTFVLFYLFATHPYRTLAAPSNNLPITFRLSLSHSPNALRWPYKANLR